MATRFPPLLPAKLSILGAARDYLLIRLGSADLLHNLVVSEPHLLCSSVRLMGAKLEWLTHTLGLSSPAAFTMLRYIIDASVKDKLDPNRQWLLREGYSREQVVAMVQACPTLLWLDLEGRLNSHKLQYLRRVFQHSARGSISVQETLQPLEAKLGSHMRQQAWAAVLAKGPPSCSPMPSPPTKNCSCMLNCCRSTLQTGRNRRLAAHGI